MSPSSENTANSWNFRRVMTLQHSPQLVDQTRDSVTPPLVKQRYGTDLRSRTLASIKPEISQAMNTLLDEVQMPSDARVLKSTNQVSSSSKTTCPHRTPRPCQKSCPMCKQVGRDSNHFLSHCTSLPDEDRKYLTMVRQIVASFQLST